MEVVKTFTAVVIALAIVISGCTSQRAPSPTIPPLPVPPASELFNPKLVMASAYNPTAVSFTPKSPTYSLPLDLTQVANSDQIQNDFNLNSGQEALLEGNGFVVIPWNGDDIVEPYKTLEHRGIPIFVTADTLLHLYHIQFNEILKRIEEEELYSQLIDMSQAMLERAENDYQAFTH